MDIELNLNLSSGLQQESTPLRLTSLLFLSVMSVMAAASMVMGA